MIIYEVNIEVVDPMLESVFLEWIRPHIREMEELNHISNTEIFKIQSKGIEFSIRYKFPDKKTLKNYLAHHAEDMRSRLPKQMAASTKFSRRILEELG